MPTNVTPTARTASAGEVETGSYLNNYRDVLNWVQAPPLCVVTFSPAITIGTSSSTPVAWNVENTDTSSMHSGSSSRFQPTYAGWYVVTAVAGWSGSAGGYRQILVRQNGGTTYAEQDTPSVGTNGMATSVTSVPIYCDGSSSYLEVYVWQNSGGNLTIGTNSYASCIWVSN